MRNFRSFTKGSENCYKFDFETDINGNSVDRITWAEARLSCENHGAEMVSLHSSIEEQKLTDLILNSKSTNTQFWIGLRDNGILGFGWSDLSALNYVNWGQNEPNNHNGQENCVMMVTNEEIGNFKKFSHFLEIIFFFLFSIKNLPHFLFKIMFWAMIG